LAGVAVMAAREKKTNGERKTETRTLDPERPSGRSHGVDDRVVDHDTAHGGEQVAAD
jgi:hypothetical protein